jgi:hypothetical protein
MGCTVREARRALDDFETNLSHKGRKH